MQQNHILVRDLQREVINSYVAVLIQKLVGVARAVLVGLRGDNLLCDAEAQKRTLTDHNMISNSQVTRIQVGHPILSI
jgi:hypothetical protein